MGEQINISVSDVGAARWTKRTPGGTAAKSALPGVAPEPKRVIPVHQKLLLASIALLPFQWALTVDVGAPLKLSEVFLGLAAIAWALSSKKKPLRLGSISTLVVVLGLIVVASTFVAALSADGLSTGSGFTRSAEADLAFYAVYSVVSLCAWALYATVPRDLFERALLVSIWFCAAAVAFQATMKAMGNTGLLEMLHFTTSGTGIDLAGGGGDALRSGPFLEGQHLGFYAGAMLILALHRRAIPSAVASVACVFFSQSTTPLVGFAIGVLIALVLTRRMKLFVTLILSAVIVFGIVVVSPQLRQLLQFQLEKLGILEGGEYATLSFDLREIKTMVGFQIAADHPILGVGPGRYGAVFFDYATPYELPWYYTQASHRAIAENAYAHIAAELGFIALAVFCVLLFLVTRRVRKEPWLVVLCVYLAVGVSTQSSWTFLPIWALLAFLCTAPPGTGEAVESSAPAFATNDNGQVETRAAVRTRGRP